MPTWKKNIFVRAIRARMVLEGKIAEELIEDYRNLTVDEKAEILSEFTE
ncbi:MAG: hypothetical protein BWY15_00413 [Firmicutes bacterium ADurb.Bin193]|nr:MAG: hypothetical protein BWY15_00413 [Firmicutes bacterium ADurb.Bin193]